jgi:hypothetical protein
VTAVLDKFGKLVEMNGRRDVTGRRHRGVARRTRSRASVAARQVVTMHGVAEVEPAWPQDEVAAHGVVDDEPRDGSRDVPRHPVARRRRSSRRQVMSRATCRRTQTCGVGQVVNDEPRDDPCDKPRDVSRHSDTRGRRSSRRRACARRSCRRRAYVR